MAVTTKKRMNKVEKATITWSVLVIIIIMNSIIVIMDLVMNILWRLQKHHMKVEAVRLSGRVSMVVGGKKLFLLQLRQHHHNNTDDGDVLLQEGVRLGLLVTIDEYNRMKWSGQNAKQSKL